MNTESPKYKRVREQVLNLLIEHDPRTATRLYNRALPDKEVQEIYTKENKIITEHGKLIDKILSLKGILIEADDQRLPDVFDKETTAIFPVKKEANTVQRDMLKSGFRRVV